MPDSPLNVSPPGLESALETAVRAARAGGAELRHRAGRELRVEHKGFRDLVSDRDLASQRAVSDEIAAAFPDHLIWGEEDELRPDHLTGLVWIIDPLDGTTNYVHGLDLYCVSVCLTVDGAPTVGVLHDPERDQTFAAAKGRGATLNGRPTRVSIIDSVAQSLLVTGFPYDVEEHLEAILTRMGRALTASQGVRRLGAAALDLAWLAAGLMDGFWEEGLQPWDMAAGALITEEAGGRVTDIDGRPFDLLSGRILATNGLIHDEMAELLRL